MLCCTIGNQIYSYRKRGHIFVSIKAVLSLFSCLMFGCFRSSEKSDLADGTFTAHEFLIPNIEDSRNNDGIVVFYKSTRLDGGVYEVEFKVDEEGFRVVGGAVIVEPARGKAAVVDFGADSRERLSFYPYTPYGDVALRLSVPAPLSRKELVDALRKEYQSEIENLKVR